MSPSIITSSFTCFLFTLFNLLSARVDLGGGNRGLAMIGTTCPAAEGIACTELGDDWPDQGLACPEARHDIPRHTLAMMSATIIQLGHYTTVPKEEFPVDKCYTIRPNSTVASYGFLSQGSFDMWFFAHDKCDCQPEQVPVCNYKATEAEKCNLRTFTLCKVTKKTEICQPKHHEGWRPSTEADQEDQIRSANSTKFQFDPTHRQNFIFNDLSGIWWKIVEIVGFLGAI